MKQKRRDQILNALLIAAAVGVLGWAGSVLLDADKTPTKIEALQEEADENREAIQGLIDLHLQKDPS
jgi:hypothetical protein